MNRETQKGFTLIELLLVIGILVILITATIVAINPFRQFALANNASRFSGTATIMDATYQNVVDNVGVFDCAAGTIPATATNMGSGATDYNVCACVVPTYVSTMPFDPQTGSYTDCATYNTGYSIARDATTGRITICAPDTQIPPEAADVCVTR